MASQLVTIRNTFNKSRTMAEACILTGIPRASICRYLAHLRKRNQITLVKFGICPITRHRAGFYMAMDTGLKGNSQNISYNSKPLL